MAEVSQPKPSEAPAVTLDEIFSHCVQMVHENKVSARNAFDLNLIDHMQDIVGSFIPDLDVDVADSEDMEHRFHEASCTLEASVKIYERRVDRVHTDAYRVLSGLQTGNDDDDPQDHADVVGTKRRRFHVNTLDKEANITAHRIECDQNDDPAFHRMAASFDAGGAKGLMLNKMPVAEDLSLVFYGEAPLQRAVNDGASLFSQTRRVKISDLGLNSSSDQPEDGPLQLCPEIDAFRYELYGNVPMAVSIPKLDLSQQASSPSTAPAEPECWDIILAPKPESQLTLDRWARRRMFRMVRKRLSKKTTMHSSTSPILHNEGKQSKPVGKRIRGKTAPSVAAATAVSPSATESLAPVACPPVVHVVSQEKTAGKDDSQTFDELFAQFQSRTQSSFAQLWSKPTEPAEQAAEKTTGVEAVAAENMITTPTRTERPKHELPRSSTREKTKQNRAGGVSKESKEVNHKSTLWKYCKKDLPKPIEDCERIKYSSSSKFVNVRRVKQNLWDCIQHGNTMDVDEQSSQSESTSFKRMVGQTVQKMPSAEVENTSAAMCFISLLHLCNENGLEIKSGAWEDLEIVRSEAATLACQGAQSKSRMGKGVAAPSTVDIRFADCAVEDGKDVN